MKDGDLEIEKNLQTNQTNEGKDIFHENEAHSR